MTRTGDEMVPIRLAPIRSQAERMVKESNLIRSAIHCALIPKKRGVVVTALHKPRESGTARAVGTIISVSGGDRSSRGSLCKALHLILVFGRQHPIDV